MNPGNHSLPIETGVDRRTVLASALGALALGGGLLPRNAHAEDDVKIGWVKPITGPLASSFAPLYLPAQIAMDEINAAGGILGRKLVKVEVDDQGSPAQSPIATRRLIEDGVKFIVGPIGSSQTLASLEVATPAKIIQASYASATEMGDGTRFPYHYQFNFTSGAQAKRHAELLAKLGIKKVGLLIEDSAAGASTRDALLKEIPANGMQIVSEQTFPIKVADMTPFLRKLRSDGAEGIAAHVSNNVDITQLLVGLSRMAWKPPIAGHTGLLFAGTPGAVPDSARYNEIYAATYRALTYTDKEQPPERVQAFCGKLLKGNVPDSLLGPAATTPFYDFIYALKYAVEKSKSWDTEQIKKALDTSNGIDGLFGKMVFSPSRHSAYDSEVVAMAVANSMEDPLSKQYHGLFRRRAPGV
ncbi:ABC transporter substrate-binding protein [Variovorax rhizosphaerae]|uniref:ABC transporter substrate-binding protein n=1 Tax=Variovorax rhizosphaerae TaxID=1836200 RepID=A0ABU8WNS6_9BURK